MSDDLTQRVNIVLQMIEDEGTNDWGAVPLIRDLLAENARLRGGLAELWSLCEEVWHAHSDPDHDHYNDCEPGEQCFWCEETHRLLDAFAPQPAGTGGPTP